MATSKCIKCDGTIFELKENEPSGSKVKFYFVQCRSCGGVVGAVEWWSPTLSLQRIEKKLGIT